MREPLYELRQMMGDEAFEKWLNETLDEIMSQIDWPVEEA